MEKNIERNEDAPAYPIDGTHLLNGFCKEMSGLTKREYFAAMAMQGLCANKIEHTNTVNWTICLNAVELADELLKRLETK